MWGVFGRGVCPSRAPLPARLGSLRVESHKPRVNLPCRRTGPAVPVRPGNSADSALVTLHRLAVCLSGPARPANRLPAWQCCRPAWAHPPQRGPQGPRARCAAAQPILRLCGLLVLWGRRSSAAAAVQVGLACSRPRPS